MSRSRWKSSTNKGAFINCVCYFSNKKSKRIANRIFRAKSKSKLIHDILTNNLKNHINYNKVQEIYDTYNFSSDGLKYYISFKHPSWFNRHCGPITKEEINKYKRK